MRAYKAKCTLHFRNLSNAGVCVEKGLDMSARSLSIRRLCGLQLKELKEAADHDPEQKHVETFKQAANIWATLPKEEKDRITAEFKVRLAVGFCHCCNTTGSAPPLSAFDDGPPGACHQHKYTRG